MTIFGAGLLVGTALTVIIPEGIRALYSDLISAQHQRVHQAAAAVAAGGRTATAMSNAVVTAGETIAAAGLAAADGNDEDAGEYSATIGLSLVLGKCRRNDGDNGRFRKGSVP